MFTAGRLYAIIGEGISYRRGTVAKVLKQHTLDSAGVPILVVQIIGDTDTTIIHSSWLFDLKNEIKEV